MSAKNRERKIVESIACPVCAAPIGRPCGSRDGRIRVCRARREAWQTWREQRPNDLVVELVTGAVLVTAITETARAWLFETPYGVWNGESLRVLSEQLAILMIAATDAGFKIGAPID